MKVVLTQVVGEVRRKPGCSSFVVEVLVVGELGGFGEIADHNTRGVDLRDGMGRNFTDLPPVRRLGSGH